METKSRLRVSSRMSNTGYHQNGKPTWWARVGDGTTAKWVKIPWTRGDKILDCIVDLPPGTTVYCGAGKGARKTVRETVVTEAIEAVADQTHACECGEWSGERCEWQGPRPEMVTVELVPEHLRNDHRKAGNAGVFPLNGAVRLLVERSCAQRILEDDREWAEILGG